MAQMTLYPERRRMIRTITLFAASFVIAMALPLDTQAQSASKDKRIYCWDEGGKRVCGDALPAEAAGAARDEISARTGLTTRQVERALTVDEQAALNQQQITQEEQQVLQAERARRAQAMVSSYDSVEAVKKGYDERIALAKVRMTSTENAIKQGRTQIVRLLSTAADMELGGKKVSPKQLAAIMKVRNTMVAMRQQAQMQATEITQIEMEREEAIALYREFTQPAAAVAIGATPAQ